MSSVASTVDTLSTRDMIEALIAGQRDPYRLADLARGKMKAKRLELIAALDGRFDDHHGELARMLLGQIDALSTQIDTLSARIEDLIAALPDHAGAIDHPDGDDGPGAGPGAGGDADPDPLPAPAPRPDAGQPRHRGRGVLSTVERLDEIPGIGAHNAQAILAEIGLDMSRFPTAEHLVSWAKLCPRTIQSGPVTAPARPAGATRI